MSSNKQTLHLSSENKKLLGVCAGIAEYLEVSALIVRLVFVVSILIGAIVLVPAYFILYFYLDKQSGGSGEGLRHHPAFRHLKNVDYKKKLYRNESKSMFLGICAGVADYLETDVKIVRIVTVALLFIAGPVPWIAYFASYYVLDVKPKEKLGFRDIGGFGGIDSAVNKIKNVTEAKFAQQSHQKKTSGRTELRYCTRKFKNLHRRLIKMEAYITSKRFKLHQEFKNIS